MLLPPFTCFINNIGIRKLKKSQNQKVRKKTKSNTNHNIHLVKFPLARWPVSSEVAKEEKTNMLTTHQVHPLPAYDINTDLIPPDDYMALLPGSHVRVSFTLNHWFINNVDIFVANIESMRILINAVAQMTPKK